MLLSLAFVWGGICPLIVQAANRTWDGGAAGADANWTTPANWSDHIALGDYDRSQTLDSHGNAIADDIEDDSKRTILATVDFVPSHSLMPVHALAISDAATEPLLPDHFLPNAETGPPAGIALGANTATRWGWLLSTVGTVTRSPVFPLTSLSHPQQNSPASPEPELPRSPAISTTALVMIGTATLLVCDQSRRKTEGNHPGKEK